MCVIRIQKKKWQGTEGSPCSKEPKMQLYIHSINWKVTHLKN
jgi:hypothetical protein